MPTDGPYVGLVLGVAEELQMSRVTPMGEGYVGDLDRVWGLSVKDDRLHHCQCIIRGIQVYPRARVTGHLRYRPLGERAPLAVFNQKGVMW